MNKVFLSALVSLLFVVPASAGPLDFSASWNSDSGKQVELSVFKGKKVVLAMFYPKCTYACPIIVEKLKRIKNKLEESKTDAQFVLISLDSAEESADRLQKYRKHMNLESPNWTLLFGTEHNLRYFSNLVNIRFWVNPKTKDISHDNVILLINEKGEIQKRIEGLSAPENELF